MSVSLLVPLEGQQTTVPLPLNYQSDPYRPWRLFLTYWTVLQPPKECLRQIIPPCSVEQDYVPWFYGKLQLKNVALNDWPQNFPDGSGVEIRLAFDQSNKPNQVFDILKFTYKWDKNWVEHRHENITQADVVLGLKQSAWSCQDGHADLSNFKQGANFPNIRYSIGSFDDAFVKDIVQDCVIDYENSGITIDDLNQGTFTVSFKRPMITRAIIQDAEIKVGQDLLLQYFFNTSFDNSWDTMPLMKPGTLNFKVNSEQAAPPIQIKSSGNFFSNKSIRFIVLVSSILILIQNII